MTVAEILRELDKRRIGLKRRGQDLECSRRPPDRLVSELRTRKSEIISCLKVLSAVRETRGRMQDLSGHARMTKDRVYEAVKQLEGAGRVKLETNGQIRLTGTYVRPELGKRCTSCQELAFRGTEVLLCSDCAVHIGS